jgi:hypothetical protein
VSAYWPNVKLLKHAINVVLNVVRGNADSVNALYSLQHRDNIVDSVARRNVNLAYQSTSGMRLHRINRHEWSVARKRLRYVKLSRKKNLDDVGTFGRIENDLFVKGLLRQNCGIGGRKMKMINGGM